MFSDINIWIILRNTIWNEFLFYLDFLLELSNTLATTFSQNNSRQVYACVCLFVSKIRQTKSIKESHWIFEITVQLAETSMHYSKYSTYDTSAMEKLLQVADQHASKVNVTENDNDEILFLQFMEKNPIWSFYSMSKDEYLSKSKEERVSLILKYYSEMKNGDNSIFSFCVWMLVTKIWLWVLFLLTQNFWTILLSVAASSPVKTAKKANVLYLSKEAMNKDQKLKMQMLMSTEGENAKKFLERFAQTRILWRSKRGIYNF